MGAPTSPVSSTTARTYPASDGLIDHRLSQRVFPPTRLSFFQPNVPGWAFRPVFVLACLASLFVVVGYHTKAAAAFLFVVAVSAYRRNILAVYVDDAIVHVLFFWRRLLPVGTTLNLPDWIRDGAASLDSWYVPTVPGASVRALLANMASVYGPAKLACCKL